MRRSRSQSISSGFRCTERGGVPPEFVTFSGAYTLHGRCALVRMRLAWLVRSSVRSGMSIEEEPLPSSLKLHRSGMAWYLAGAMRQTFHSAPTKPEN